jgi:hypothetical protein
MPDFICIGGQRTGTTWLHHVLSANDTVWMPPCKELHHYDALCPDIETYPYRYREHLTSRARHYGLALARAVTRREIRPDVAVRTDFDWDLRYFLRSRSPDWYRSLFTTRAAQGRVTGEITPAYSLLPQTHVDRIAAELPEVRILAILRDPVARARSHALKDMDAAAAKDPARLTAFLRDPACLGRSDWPAILGRWRAAIPEERLLVLDFDGIRTDPAGFLEQVAAFLGTELRLPGDATGGSLRERGSSTYRAGGGGLPEAVQDGIADLYAPLLRSCAEALPGMAAPWLERNAGLLARAG